MVQSILEQMIASSKTPSFAEVEEQIKSKSKDRNMSVISGAEIITHSLKCYHELLQIASEGGAVI